MITTTQTTKNNVYADYLIKNQKSILSKFLQWPYRTHLKILNLGRTLDIGCGAGRNLKALNPESVGIDHNKGLVDACVAFGLKALTTDAFLSNAKPYERGFNSILISHVAEHMEAPAFTQLLKEYRRFLKPGGRVLVICPQEKGYHTDSTHVQFMDFALIEKALVDAGFTRDSHYSFPFPRSFGKFFPHNEFVVMARG